MSVPLPLGPFDLLQPIGRGSLGEVWRGVHRPQGIPVAVKLMSAEATRDRDTKSAFRTEVRAAAALDHPSIVMVLDHGVLPDETVAASDGRYLAGSLYLVMELASGGSLLEAAEEAVSWLELRGTLLTLLDALAHAHARGVIHRDLRPSNVLVCADDDLRPGLKVSDFGIAYAAAWGAGAGKALASTAHFTAPEQLDGDWRDQGPWTDLYSLGCLAWQLATGLPVFASLDGDELRHAQRESEPPGFAPRRSVPGGFEQWMRRLLSKDPADRFRFAADAAWALRRLGDVRRGAAAGGLGTAASEGGLRAQGTLADVGGSILGTQLYTLHEDMMLSRAARSRGGLPPMPAEWRHPRTIEPHPLLYGAGLGLFWLRSMPMVGREEERDQLWQALSRVDQNGSAEAVVLTGPSGTGRSRVAEWICERALELGTAHVLHATHGKRSDPRQCLRKMVAQHLNCSRLKRVETGQRVRRFLATHGESDPYEADALTEFLVPATRRERKSGEGVVTFTTTDEPYAVIRNLLGLLTADRPVIVWCDDVQWGADALEFAVFMLRSQLLTPAPVLLLLTASDEALVEQPEEAARIDTLLELPNTRRVVVPPLSEAEHAHLVKNLLVLEGDLALLVQERTAGNPLFAVQLVGDWVLRGVLEMGRTGFRVREGARIDLPDDLHEVWANRVERLLEDQPEFARQALELAAVLGLEVDDDEWQEVTDDPTGYLRKDLTGGRFGFKPKNMRMRADLVDALLEGRLASETDEGWAFIHPMFRESLERQAWEAGRLEEHHRACASMLQRRHGEGQRGAAERVGRHLYAAGELDASISPLLEGARDRIDTTGAREARALLATARQAMKQLGLPAQDSRWGWLSVACCRLGLFRGNTETAKKWGKRGVGVARVSGDEALLPDALRAMANAHIRTAEFDEARKLLDEARQAYSVNGDEYGLAKCLMSLADTTGDPVERRAFLERAHERFQQTGDEIQAANALRAMAVLHAQHESWVEAIPLFEKAYALSKANGHRIGLALVSNGLADVARRMGELDRAEEGYTEALEIFESIGSVLANLPRLNLALILLDRGHRRKAREVLTPALRYLEENPQRPLLEFAYVTMLPCAAAASDWAEWDRAMAALRRLLVDSRHYERDVARTAAMGGDLARNARQFDRARAAYSLAADQWEALGDLERADEMRAASKPLGG